MRTTLDIDDDVLQAAKELARAEKKTAGQVLSDLARKALTPTAASKDTSEYVVRDGWYTRRSTGGLVTNEQIDRIKAELDREDMERAIAPGRQRSSDADG